MYSFIVFLYVSYYCAKNLHENLTNLTTTPSIYFVSNSVHQSDFPIIEKCSISADDIHLIPDDIISILGKQTVLQIWQPTNRNDYSDTVNAEITRLKY